MSEDVFEILIDLFTSPGSKHRQDCCVPEAHVYTQDRDRARPLKRRVAVSMRTLTRQDRDAFTAAKQKGWASWLDKEAAELVKNPLIVPRSHHPCSVVAYVEERWNGEGSNSPIVRTWISPRFTTLRTSSPTLTSDGESAIFQWIVLDGHVLESGDLNTAFLSGDPNPAHKGSDALYINPPSDLKCWLNLGPENVLRLRKAVCGLINAPLRLHQGLSRALRQAGFVSLQMDPCVWILPVPSPVERDSSVDVPSKLRTAVVDSFVSPATEIRMDLWKRQRNVQGVLGVHVDYLLVVEILLFRKLCSGSGQSLGRFRFRGRE